MIVPVTFIGSVVVVPCLLFVEPGWANASGAITIQPSVTINFFIFASYLLMHVLLGEFLEIVRMEQEPLRAFPAAHFRGAGTVQYSQKVQPSPYESINRCRELSAMSGSSRRCTHVQIAHPAGS